MCLHLYHGDDLSFNRFHSSARTRKCCSIFLVFFLWISSEKPFLSKTLVENTCLLRFPSENPHQNLLNHFVVRALMGICRKMMGIGQFLAEFRLEERRGKHPFRNEAKSHFLESGNPIICYTSSHAYGPELLNAIAVLGC